VLQPLQSIFKAGDHPALLVGLNKADDAAVYQLDETRAIISTTDFFPPIVDDPYDFGAIAAANAMSDVYAMGGQVLFAINLVAFPDNLDRDILREILRGGAEKVAEAGGIIAGGHSVTDREPKYGLAVTGIIDPQQVKKKGGGRPGDVLLLTKPLGVGVLTTALKQGKAKADDIAVAVTSMKRLNKTAAEAALATGANGMTDVTGFGLLGHAREMASQGSVDFHIDAAKLPWLPGALACGELGTFPGGMLHNLDYFAPHVTFGPDVTQLEQDMLWTPETSGGLLVAIVPDQVEMYRTHCETAVVIGHVTRGTGHIFVK
jgi:selenide, water dikinase